MQKDSFPNLVSVCWTQNKRNDLKCLIGFIVVWNKMFPLFSVQQTDAARKTDLFTPRRKTKVENLELFWQC